MAKEVIIPITNGLGSKSLANGTYNITSLTLGYSDVTITPATATVEDGVTSFNFTIAATGALTIHVSDDGTDAGVPIEGATFARCDADGKTYGDPITSDADGNAVFNAVPFSADGTPPTIYYKQTASDGAHTFDDTLQSTTSDAEAKTIELGNAEAASVEVHLTDATYADLPIADGKVVFTEPDPE